MSGRSKWKNTPEGKTVKRNSVAQYFTSRPVELQASPAFRVLSLSAQRALARIELELRQHAGNGNGRLVVTKKDFMEYGIHQRMLAPALRELDALGIAIITVRGRGGNAEHRQPAHRFLLNYMCGAVDAHNLITNSWKRFKSLEEADQVASAARNAKDPVKVSYGRPKLRPQKHFPGTQSVPETRYTKCTRNLEITRYAKCTHGSGTQSVPTTDISGGGGEEAASIEEMTRPPAHAPLGHNAGPPPESDAEFEHRRELVRAILAEGDQEGAARNRCIRPGRNSRTSLV